ncbi:MAG TPA: heat-inducible transcriptional repressor HrcA [Acidiferrobacter sp.]|nr:heat-inducible transcriptional repressor HrcA [Acidiferrobacter sp.]
MISLTPRAERLLKALIEQYIAEGQPVGSRTLVRQAGLEFSPATVRNIMSDLEEFGLIRSPHTSAGRVPTERGYRFFVNSLLAVKPLYALDLSRIEGHLLADQDPQQLLESASGMLSQITKLAGIVRVPRRTQAGFLQLDFLSLSASRVLVILVSQDGQVLNRVIHPKKRYSASELQQAANIFNSAYAGLSLEEVKRCLVAALERDSEDMQQMLRSAVEMAHQVFTDGEFADDPLFVSGESNLLAFPELSNMEKLRQLFDAFNAKQDLLHLLDHSMSSSGVQIFIGAESGYESLASCSVVTAPYEVDGKVVGTVGVVGPTRMSYDRVISIVDVTARFLGGALSHDPADDA